MKCFMDLHSSMDRFKVPPGVNYEQNILPLHSSMDRFKDNRLLR